MLEHYLYPGMLFVDKRPHRVTTILGSCIAVCLFDPVLRIGGLNHFLLPLWNGDGLPTPRYGTIAIDTLIEQLRMLGGPSIRLKAKFFGGAALWNNSGSSVAVGCRNIVLARSMLVRYGIPVVSEDVGGTVGRKIIFFTATGEVLLRRQLNSALQERPAGDDKVFTASA